MTAPDVGAFGVAALVVVLVARVAALAALTPDVLLVAGLWAASRAAMGVTMGLVPYARDEGIASGFAGRSVAPAAVTAIVVLVVAAVAVGGWAGPVTALAAAGGFAAVVGLALRRVGGYTGDVLGAAGVVAETVGLLVAAARW
jgi:adenosylcobinamide-GDP ribazoletransferase